MIPSVVLHSRASVHSVGVEVSSTQKKKLENLYKQQERPLFNVYNTVKLFKTDFQLSLYAFDTLALGSKNPVLDKFNEKYVLAEMSP